MPTATKKRATNSTGGTAVRGPTTGKILCHKVTLKVGSKTIYNGVYPEKDWPEILRQFNSLFMGAQPTNRILFDSTAVMATPTTRLT